MIGSQNGKEAGVSPTLQPFFLLGNQVVRVFRLKDRLIKIQGIFMQGLWKDKFSSCKEASGNSLVDHLLKGSSQPDEDVDVHMLDFGPESMFM